MESKISPDSKHLVLATAYAADERVAKPYGTG